MPLRYVASDSARLRQGEIIEDLVELGPVASDHRRLEADEPRVTAQFERIRHPYVIVISQDCDLEWDYGAREGSAPEHKLLRHVLFCDLFPPAEVRQRGSLTSGLFDRVKQNQDERYHRFDGAAVGDAGDFLPELVADFKSVFSLPTEFVYSLTSTDELARRGFLPPPYLQHFTHRLHSYLSRVALPD